MAGRQASVPRRPPPAPRQQRVAKARCPACPALAVAAREAATEAAGTHHSWSIGGSSSRTWLPRPECWKRTSSRTRPSLQLRGPPSRRSQQLHDRCRRSLPPTPPQLARSHRIWAPPQGQPRLSHFAAQQGPLLSRGTARLARSTCLHLQRRKHTRRLFRMELPLSRLHSHRRHLAPSTSGLPAPHHRSPACKERERLHGKRPSACAPQRFGSLRAIAATEKR